MASILHNIDFPMFKLFFRIWHAFCPIKFSFNQGDKKMHQNKTQSKFSRIKNLLILLFAFSALHLTSCSTQELPTNQSIEQSAVERQTTRSTSHSQIVINGDADFTSANGVTGGNGTQADPYRISGWYINGYLGGVAIDIANTTKHVIIEDNELFQSVIGIKLESAPNVTIRNNVIRDMKGWAGIFPAGNGDPAFGIYISSSNAVTITGNNIYRIYGGAGAAGSMSLSNGGQGGQGGEAMAVFTYASNNLSISSNTLSYIYAGAPGAGAAGTVGAFGGKGGDGGHASDSYGLRIISSNPLSVQSNSISLVYGSAGAAGGAGAMGTIYGGNGGNGGKGGNAWGLNVTYSSNIVSSFNVINDIWAGAAGAGAAGAVGTLYGGNGGNGGHAGHAYAIYFGQSSTIASNSNQITTIRGAAGAAGGMGALYYYYGIPFFAQGGNGGNGGNAFGITMDSSSSYSQTSNTFSSVIAGLGGLGAVSSGVDGIDGSSMNVKIQ